MTILVVVGTRPEIIKMAPVILELEKNGLEFVFVHTRQHYDYEMSRVFIEELGLPKPHYSFELKGESPPQQIGEMMINLEKVIKQTKKQFKIMLIQGDTNSMLAAGLTALKENIKIGHVEAGLRSYDWRMPEEHNRRMIDHVSDYLFAPTEKSKNNLLEEHVWGKIFVTGNTVIDAIKKYLPIALKKASDIITQIKFDEYAIVTFHRAENVDDPITLSKFVKILEKSSISLVFPIHPRTKKRLEQYRLFDKVQSMPHLQLLPPLGYFEFLVLMKDAKVILTDSGGLQEEATAPEIRKPVLVLRTSTERPEAVEKGFAHIVGVDPPTVISKLRDIIDNTPKLPMQSPFGNGDAGVRIVKIVRKIISV